MHKFLTRPENRVEVSSRESLPSTRRSRVAVEAPASDAQRAALESYSEPSAREVVLASPFVSARGDTMPSVQSSVVRSRAAGFQGWRIP
jgi:hypothetical protein